ncbi:hypothetical protein HBH98_175250 [Parastagonospora nodorum]|nr:hypothetical protein HBH53_046160 [Parastagonospora nodorum]KAH4341712.1 hypothetical protein HBH98_175250 [Parastagonospora nodorum]KAH4369841.1 hypothetical protein HBH97_144810 [Parastagonospora nodorum]KAH4387719.1 hypothetical protein HBH99_167210 [Parastagonospora nodorum]KAH4815960.1 hypothetical protein HBH61_060850 [Parastagonospora nodorum]
MSLDLYGSRYEPTRLFNPWEEFMHRDESKHAADSKAGFRLGHFLPPSPTPTSPTAAPPPLPTRTSREVVELFLTYGRHRLDDAIPHQQKLLKDFMQGVIAQSPVTSTAAPQSNYIDDLKNTPVSDIALLDDRNNHDGCLRKYDKHCSNCYVVSKKMAIRDLCTHLEGERKTRKFSVDRRIVFIPNLTPHGALLLAATCARRSAIPMRDFLHRYLGRQQAFSVRTSWGFFTEFHISYHAIRLGPIGTTTDPRKVSGKSLRHSAPLPLRSHTGNDEDLYYHEAQTSSLCWGPDETFWTELFLVDTYFGSEQNLGTYLENPSLTIPGNGFDPPLGGRQMMKEPVFDPREYFLMKIDRRIEQVATEYRALVETFNKRMEDYAIEVRIVFQDDDQRKHTQTLSNVIETIHTFVDCISGIIDAWESFSRHEIVLFTRHAPEKLKWPDMLMQINRNMTELDRLRKLLITKRELFRSKLESLHTVSSLSQTDTAVKQGNDLKTLTKMTVYVAFPLLFTTAFFSMSFANPPYPWAVFICVLFMVGVVNYIVAETWGNGGEVMVRWVVVKLRS